MRLFRRPQGTRSALVACRTCGFASAPATPTCPYCGIDPAYVAPDEMEVYHIANGSPYPAPGVRDLVPIVTAVAAVFAIVTTAFGVWTYESTPLALAAVMAVLGAVALWDLDRRYRPRRQTTGTLKEAEARLDAALAEAHGRWERLETLHRHTPATAPEAEAVKTLDGARRVLAARIDALARARFDLRLVWWKNRVDLALARSSVGEATAHDTLTALTELRDEAVTVLSALDRPGADNLYADVRPRLAAARTALDALIARLFDASVAEAVAGISAPLDGLSVVRAEVQAALDGLAAVAEAAPATARADALARESIRIALEVDDLVDAPDAGSALEMETRVRG